MTWLLFTILSSASTLFGIAVTKSWITNNKLYLFVLALILYALSGLFYMFAIRIERIVLIEPIWTAIVLLATLALGFFVFHERVSVQEGIGIILVITAVVLFTVKFSV